MFREISTIGGILILMLIVVPNVYSQDCNKYSGAGICVPEQTISSESADAIANLMKEYEENWGTATEISEKLSSVEFRPMYSDLTYWISDGWTYIDSGMFTFLFGALHFPSGAKLNHFYVTVMDTNATADINTYFMICPSSSAGCTQLPSTGCGTSGTPGYTLIFCNLSSFNIVIDNNRITK